MKYLNIHLFEFPFGQFSSFNPGNKRIMSEDVKNPGGEMGEMSALPEKFLEQFRCGKCKKYLRPPVMTMCNKGHKVCGICSASGTPNCSASPECQRVSKNMQDVTVEAMIKVGIYLVYIAYIYQVVDLNI